MCKQEQFMKCKQKTKLLEGYNMSHICNTCFSFESVNNDNF